MWIKYNNLHSTRLINMAQVATVEFDDKPSAGANRIIIFYGVPALDSNGDEQSVIIDLLEFATRDEAFDAFNSILDSLKENDGGTEIIYQDMGSVKINPAHN